MARIICHSAKQKAELFKIAPTKNDVAHEYVLYLKRCCICDNPVLEIIRFDIWGELLPSVRLKSNNIKGFLEKMSVLEKPRKICFTAPKGGFYLNYSEYGSKKRCYQNISTLQLGKLETDPRVGLQGFL